MIIGVKLTFTRPYWNGYRSWLETDPGCVGAVSDTANDEKYGS